MFTRPLLAVATVLLLLLGPFGLAIHSGDPVGIDTESEDRGISFDELTPAQLHSLEELPATAQVSVRAAGRAADSQLGWEWAMRAGGITNDSEGDYGYGIAIDSSGNAYVTGSFIEGPAADFGNTTLSSLGGQDVFVAKLDSSGNWLWAKRAGGDGWDLGYGIAVDSSGNAYITGQLGWEWANFGNTMLSSPSSGDVFVAKLDSSGNWLWAKRAGGDGWDCGYGIAVDSSGNAYITGRFQGASADFGNTTLSSSGYSDVFVSKLDSSGNWLWAVHAVDEYGDDEQGNGIAVDSSGNTYIIGSWTGRVNFGNHELDNPGSRNVFVAKLDWSGNWLWAKRAGWLQSPDEVKGNSIAVDSSGNAYITGFFTGGFLFVDNALNSSGSRDVFVAKLDSSGNWLWAKRAGGTQDDRGFSIVVDSYGDTYVTGVFSTRGSSADFGNTTLSSLGSGNTSVFVAKLDSSGNWQWAKRAGGSTGSLGRGIALDSSGNAYITGFFFGASADFGNSTLSSSGSRDVFVAGLSLDSDGDSVPDIADDCANGANGWVSSPTSDHDGDGCRDIDEDDDDDGDEIPDASDPCPAGILSGPDHDGDGCRDSEDDDDDNDGFTDATEADCGSNSTDSGSVPVDIDNDGICDALDPDADGDGAYDTFDLCPNSLFLEPDYDGDGCPDGEDDDDDDDGFPDASDLCPLGMLSGLDHDGDGCRDLEDDDDDDDGVNDDDDGCPRGDLGWTSGSTTDRDSDGCQDSNEDSDLDGDGYDDLDETTACDDGGPYASFSNPLDSEDTPADMDGDLTCDALDSDRDGDGYDNTADVFPDDANEAIDTDADGFGDNGDACPNNFGTSYNDRKGCIDQDGDGVSDLNDAFWMFSSVSVPLSTVLLWMVSGIVVTVVGVVVVIKRRTFKSEDANSSSPNVSTDKANEHQQWTDEQGHIWRRYSDGRTEWWNGTDWQDT